MLVHRRLMSERNEDVLWGTQMCSHGSDMLYGQLLSTPEGNIVVFWSFLMSGGQRILGREAAGKDLKALHSLIEDEPGSHGRKTSHGWLLQAALLTRQEVRGGDLRMLVSPEDQTLTSVCRSERWLDGCCLEPLVGGKSGAKLFRVWPKSRSSYTCLILKTIDLEDIPPSQRFPTNSRNRIPVFR